MSDAPFAWDDLGKYKAEGRFLDGYPDDQRTFFAPRDDVHGLLVALLDSAQRSIVISMFGHDDYELNKIVQDKLARRAAHPPHRRQHRRRYPRHLARRHPRPGRPEPEANHHSHPARRRAPPAALLASQAPDKTRAPPATRRGLTQFSKPLKPAPPSRSSQGNWSPVDGCEDPATAIRRADAFAFAVSQKGVEDGTFWSAKASDYLRGYFHAAALAGYDLRAVAAWVSGADPHIPERILAAAGARQWAPSAMLAPCYVSPAHAFRAAARVAPATSADASCMSAITGLSSVLRPKSNTAGSGSGSPACRTATMYRCRCTISRSRRRQAPTARPTPRPPPRTRRTRGSARSSSPPEGHVRRAGHMPLKHAAARLATRHPSPARPGPDGRKLPRCPVAEGSRRTEPGTVAGRSGQPAPAGYRW